MVSADQETMRIFKAYLVALSIRSRGAKYTLHTATESSQRAYMISDSLHKQGMRAIVKKVKSRGGGQYVAFAVYVK
ncbi:MAG: hypothetical protein WC346_04040 [Methanogenium sp.]|jgi:ATP/ADP translocase